MTAASDPSSPGMTAADLQAVIFHETRLKAGYNEDEVDDFIDHVADEITALRARIEELEAQNSELRGSHNASSGIVEAATETAAQTLREADQYSLRVVEEARTTARQIIAEAKASVQDGNAATEPAQDGQTFARVRDATHGEIRGYLLDRLAALDRFEAISHDE